MTKKQKIWFAIFAAMFLIPEVLWSPVGNFYYELIKPGNDYPIRDNFLMKTDNANLLVLVFSVQAIGLIGLFIWFLVSGQKKFIKLPGLVLSALGLLSICFALYLFYAFRAWR
jgi:hypothetical protein